MFWEPDEIQEEIREKIRKFHSNKIMTDGECNRKYEEHCSIWGSFEELLEYLQDDDDRISKEELLKYNGIFELSNGEWLLC